MAVVSEISDKPLDLLAASFSRTPRANPQTATGLPSGAIGEPLNDVGGVLVVAANGSGSQPAKGLAVAGGVMVIRALLAFLPIPATAIPHPLLLFVGCELSASRRFSRVG